MLGVFWLFFFGANLRVLKTSGTRWREQFGKETMSTSTESTPLETKKQKHTALTSSSEGKQVHTITNDNEQEQTEQHRANSTTSIFFPRRKHDVAAFRDVVRVLFIPQADLCRYLLTVSLYFRSNRTRKKEVEVG